MIDKLVQQTIQNLETNYVGEQGERIVIHLRYYIGPTEKWYRVYRTSFTPVYGTPYVEITYYNSLAFLYYYYFTPYKHIFLKSEHPELLI